MGKLNMFLTYKSIYDTKSKEISKSTERVLKEELKKKKKER